MENLNKTEDGIYICIKSPLGQDSWTWKDENHLMRQHVSEIQGPLEVALVGMETALIVGQERGNIDDEDEDEDMEGTESDSDINEEEEQQCRVEGPQPHRLNWRGIYYELRYNNSTLTGGWIYFNRAAASKQEMVNTAYFSPDVLTWGTHGSMCISQSCTISLDENDVIHFTLEVERGSETLTEFDSTQTDTQAYEMRFISDDTFSVSPDTARSGQEMGAQLNENTEELFFGPDEFRPHLWSIYYERENGTHGHIYLNRAAGSEREMVDTAQTPGDIAVAYNRGQIAIQNQTGNSLFLRSDPWGVLLFGWDYEGDLDNFQWATANERNSVWLGYRTRPVDRDAIADGDTIRLECRWRNGERGSNVGPRDMAILFDRTAPSKQAMIDTARFETARWRVHNAQRTIFVNVAKIIRFVLDANNLVISLPANRWAEYSDGLDAENDFLYIGEVNIVGLLRGITRRNIRRDQSVTEHIDVNSWAASVPEEALICEEDQEPEPEAEAELEPDPEPEPEEPPPRHEHMQRRYFFNDPPNAMIVQCSLCDYDLMSNAVGLVQKLKILYVDDLTCRTVQTDTNIIFRPMLPHYKKVVQNEFSHITFIITDSEGQNIPWRDPRSINILLHIRPIVVPIW